MGSRLSGIGLCLVLAMAVGSCGGDPPEAARVPTVTGVETDADGGVSASARLTKQRWIVEDACADGRDTRARLIDFTDGTLFPARGYWLVRNGTTLNRVIECERSHQICLGAVQDPPPGLVWGVGMRGERYPCRSPNRCCFACNGIPHRLTLSCRARTSPNLAEPEAEGEILVEGDEGSFE